MNCDDAKAFLSSLDEGEQPSASIAPVDLDFLARNGYVLEVSGQEHDQRVENVARLSQITGQVDTARQKQQAVMANLQQDEQKEHSFTFHLEGEEEKQELEERIQTESAEVSDEQTDLTAAATQANELIEEKSMVDRMVRYDGGYLSITDLGKLVLNDLVVRDYRVAEEDFADFLAETKATYAELTSIADRATQYNLALRSAVSGLETEQPSQDGGAPVVEVSSLMWSVTIGLAKLQGDVGVIGERFANALHFVEDSQSTVPNKLMAAEVITGMGSQDVTSLGSALNDLEDQLKHDGVPKEQSVGVAATILAGRRYDGTYPIDNFPQFRGLTPSSQAASLLAIMNVPFEDLASKFNAFRSMFTSWGYKTSDDTEVASAFLAVGELGADEVEEKLKYIIEQLKNYLEYPLVAAAILASIPVFEVHEVLDLMEKAVTLLSAYAKGLERSELVVLAVRMIHGVRNEVVREIDATAKLSPTPIQFTFPLLPGLLIWYRGVILVHAPYAAVFGGMGAFHPAHDHGLGGFAG